MASITSALLKGDPKSSATMNRRMSIPMRLSKLKGVAQKVMNEQKDKRAKTNRFRDLVTQITRDLAKVKRGAAVDVNKYVSHIPTFMQEAPEDVPFLLKLIGKCSRRNSQIAMKGIDKALAMEVVSTDGSSTSKRSSVSSATGAYKPSRNVWNTNDDSDNNDDDESSDIECVVGKMKNVALAKAQA